jgi:hypothetical protein
MTENAETKPADTTAPEKTVAERLAGMGLRFDAEEVSKQRGDNASDKTVIGIGQIAIVTDLALFEAAMPGVVLGSLNGTSVRVMSQDVSRRSIEKGVKGADAIQAAVLNRLRGVRNNGGGTKIVTVTKIVHSNPLPDGSQYAGTDETEYRALYAAALVDAGVPTEAALSIANNQKLNA